jgi:hypothetical protein
MSMFDTLQDTAFSVVTTTMGDAGSWIPSGGGAEQTAKVLYNGPTEKEKLLSAEYDPERVYIEYQSGSFPGLFETVKSSATMEVITITGKGDFYVKSVTKEWDGKSFKAYLKFKP